MNDTIINDSYIVSKYMIHTNKKDMIRPSFNKMINLNENNPDKLYLLQRYKDSESLHETVQRIFYKIEIKPICPICGAPVKWLGKKKRLMLKTCSDVKCFGKFRYEEAKKTNLLKYGVENCYQSSEKQEKIRNTLISKYGVDNPLKSEKIKEKLKHTCLIKYGVTNGGWTPQSIKKIQETNLKVRGVTCPFKDDKVKEKIKNTCLKKYGVSSASKSKEIKEKIRNTCLKKYGTEYYFQSNEYRKDLSAYLEKQRQTIQKILKDNILEDEIPKLSKEDFENYPPFLSLSDTFYTNDICYNYEEYLEHLTDTKKYMSNHNNYKILENKINTFRNINITIHSGKWVMISKNTHPTIHFVIHHPKLRDAIENFIPPVVE